MQTLKKIAKTLIACGLAAAISGGVCYSVMTSVNQVPTIAEIQHAENVSPTLPPGVQSTLRRSRNSTVRILSISDKGGVATTTGTYVRANGNYYVVTVMHGLVGPCGVTRIWTEEEGFTPCQQVVIGSALIDYAVIQVGEIPSLEAIPIPRALPRASQWRGALSTQTKLYYTGYPNSTGPLTFAGTIVGYADGDYIYMHSFAWGGASGSGVFSETGEFIGYVLAIDIGETTYGIDVLEDIVIVVPAFKIDWATILEGK